MIRNFIYIFLVLPLCLWCDLRIGMELSYPPFEMVCPDGSPCGISVDITEALGKYLHEKIEIKNMAFVGLIPDLNNGGIDAIISSMTITSGRQRRIDFSQPYVTTGLCLLVSSQSDLTNISEANSPNRIIVVKSGTSGEVYAVENLTKATVRVLALESMCLLEVVQGKADAFIYDQLAVYTLWKKFPDKTRAILKPFQKEHWGIGVRKGHQKLLVQINDFITQFRQEGGFEKLKQRYLSVQAEAFQELGIPLVF